MVQRKNKGEGTEPQRAGPRKPKDASTDRKFILKLYITGMTPRSVRAIENIKKICEEHLEGNYRLEVIDIYQQPTLARGDQIIAVPTLVRKLPLPLRKFIGDLSDSEKILMGLDIKPGKARNER